MYLCTYYEALNGEIVAQTVITSLLSNLVQIDISLTGISKLIIYRTSFAAHFYSSTGCSSACEKNWRLLHYN